MVEGEFPKVDGDILFSSEVNGFNDKGLILSDDAGPYTENTTTPTLKVTHVIGAGIVDDNIDIIIEKLHNMAIERVGTETGATDYFIRIDIGETGSEITKRTIFNKMNVSGGVTSPTIILDETNIFNYSPTTDEKTNGFNVKIFIYVDGIAGGGVSAAESKIGRTFVRNI